MCEAINTKFYVWINAKSTPVTRAYSYEDEIELCAEQESPPAGAYKLRTGSKSELIARYNLDESDFDNT